MKLNKLLVAVLFGVAALMITGCRDKAYQAIEKAPDLFQERISEGLTDNLNIKNCYTISSKEYPGSYYVGGELFGPDMGGVVAAVWILDNYNDPENILSVNQPAIAFSIYKAAKYDKPRASITNIKEARILKKYIERKYYSK